MSDEVPNTIDRRKFLTVLGVTGGGAAMLSGCSTDRIQKLVPYLVQSEDQVPGLPTIYASTCTECAAGCGLHVRTREGRAIKLEGNPDHPVNKGKLCSLGQSALQSLYHPSRLKGPMARNAAGALAPVTWDVAIATLAEKAAQATGKVAVISGSPRGTFSTLLADWAAALGGRVVRYQPFDHEAVRSANAQVFGVDQLPTHDFSAARHIVSFGADFLESWLAPVENQRGFAEARDPSSGEAAKFVAFAPRLSLTAMNADEWHVTRPGGEAAVALAMANVILGERSGAPADANGLRGALAKYTVEMASQASGIGPEEIRRAAREFASASPSLAVAGGIGSQHRGAIELCAAVNLLNYIAGNVGKTVNFGADPRSWRRLWSHAPAGPINGAGPGRGAPGARGQPRLLAAPLGGLPRSPEAGSLQGLHLALPRRNQFGLRPHHPQPPRAGAVGRCAPPCRIHGMLQPVMEPVHRPDKDHGGTMATGDVLLKVSQKAGGPLARFTAPTFEDHLKASFATAHGGGDPVWRAALQKGGVFDPAPVTQPRLAAGAGQPTFTPPEFDGNGDFFFTTFASVYHDGRGANRPWLLELPDPVTKITWHSWVEIHPETAKAMNVKEGEILRLTSPAGSIEAPAYVHLGIHPNTVAVPLGLGHTEYGEWGSGRGVNPLNLLSARDGQGFLPYGGTKVSVAKTGGWIKVAKTEGNPRQLGRGIANAMPIAAVKQGLTLEQFERGVDHEEHEENTPLEVEALKGFRESQQEQTRRGEYAREHPQWGMTIDLARCTGCSACVVACYSENNIPWVGEDEVRRGREMSWMRIERYWEGGDNGQPLEGRVIPMLCQHCGNAPCEPVCPVYAAYHTADGLNGQVYNRCVGTRYCSNNCPYKVRYFNWFSYGKKAFPQPLNFQLNPDVVVRARGVMEKCTFCIQRIRAAQNAARLADRALVDGEFTSACAQACPSDAIVFGNRSDPASRVSKSAEDKRGYHVLEELNTRPAITYLAKVLHRSEA
jgi:molybdopterin-containing oxidoreductase family iron-sulfur binding subunit